MPGPTIALLVEGLLSGKKGEAQPAGVAGERDARLDRRHAAPAQLVVAFAEAGAVLGQSPGDPHQGVAVFGEAAMFTAQRAGEARIPIGMNAPSAAQNSAFMLRVVRWLATGSAEGRSTQSAASK